MKTYKEYRLSSSNSSCSFPVRNVMFQFVITSLRQNCRLRVAFKCPRVEVCDVPTHLPKCTATEGRTWAQTFGQLIGDTVANFLNRPSAAIPNAVPSTKSAAPHKR